MRSRTAVFAIFATFIIFLEVSAIPDSNQKSLPPYQNPHLSFEARARDLIVRMTLEEKISQLVNDSPAISRLGIEPYNWWSEALHGVARAGIATVFPQAIALAAAWDVDLVRKMADCIAEEARAKYNESIRNGIRQIYGGLTFWSPNINIFRDPRWGRGQETYGEDPFLTAELGVQFVKGLQGDDPRYLKLVATPKHFAVHSGPEKERHRFDVGIGMKEMKETYLYAFKEVVIRANAQSVMCAYNRVNDAPACASKALLTDLLRKEWGFSGYVVSDCDAVADIHSGHKIVATAAEAAATALRNGCDLNCGRTFETLRESVKKKLVSEREIDMALKRLLLARFRLGMFDPPEIVPFTSITMKSVDSPENRELALRSARESIVLLKNENHLLPLKKNLRRIAVIGPNSDTIDILLGNYYGTPSRYVTPLQGIYSRIDANTRVSYSRGCDILDPGRREFGQAVEIAKNADVVILFMGLSPRIEGEEGETQEADRKNIDLPGIQEELLKEIHRSGKPMVLVLLNGSPVSINWADRNIPAILEAWYPGEEGGTAIADVIFGDYNPGGRLPVTFVRSLDQLPPFADYGMKGRTYRYLNSEPLYPFGYGLSYTTFAYSGLTIHPSRFQTGETATIEVNVENTGDRSGDEVVQLYVSDLQSSVPVPIRQLQGFRRIFLNPGEKRTVHFTLSPRQFALINGDGECILEPGRFLLAVGGGQPLSIRPDGTSGFLTMEIEMKGKPQKLKF